MARKLASQGTKFMVSYESAAPKQHDFTKERTLSSHIAQLCRDFGIQEPAENYVIRVEKDGLHSRYLNQVELETGIIFQTGMGFRLKKNTVTEVTEIIDLLQYGTPAIQKKAVFDLSKKHLADLDFVREFLHRDGIEITTNLVKTAEGGTLAHTLQALETAMSFGYGWESISDDVIRRIVELVHDSTKIQVQQNALRICAHLIGNEKAAGFWVVHRELVIVAQSRQQQPYEAIISALKNEDLNIKVGALQIINSFIEHAPDKAIFEEFLLLIENFGYLEELKAQLVTVKSADFRKAVLWHQVAKSNHWGREKEIPYDKTCPEHEETLMELWRTCFPSKKLENRVSEQWKLLGFQGTDPATDFRGMGLLGLKHILYFAKNYTEIFVDMAQIQAKRESHYYPVSTAGINISAMLLEILKIGKGKGEVHQIFPILFDHHRALEEMYCLVFRLFHRVWDEMGADYMDFKNVADQVKEMTVNALEQSNDLCAFAKALDVSVMKNSQNQRRRVSALLDMASVNEKVQSKVVKKSNFRKTIAPSNFRAHLSIQIGSADGPKRHTAPAGVAEVSAAVESMSFVSDNVTLDIYVALAHQCSQQTVSRNMSVKAVVEQTCKSLKKKMRKPKKGEIQQLYLPATRIWLDDQRKVWSYLLKEKERLELKAKPPPLGIRRADIKIQLENTTFTQPVEYMQETTVRGIIQSIDKPKSIVQNIHQYGLFLEEEGSNLIWLDEGRSLASYGLSKCQLVFSLKDVLSSAGGKSQPIMLQIQVDGLTKQMQFDESNTSGEVLEKLCRGGHDPNQFFLFFADRKKNLALELPIAAYGVTSSSILVLKQRPSGWLPDSPSVNLGLNLEGLQFRSSDVGSSSSQSGEEEGSGGFASWSVDEVCEWVKSIGMGEHEECFRQGGIDGKALSEITQQALRGLGIAALGVRKEIVRQIRLLN